MIISIHTKLGDAAAEALRFARAEDARAVVLHNRFSGRFLVARMDDVFDGSGDWGAEGWDVGLQTGDRGGCLSPLPKGKGHPPTDAPKGS